MSTRTDQKQSVGAFDIRNVIGGLIGAYGAVLTLVGTFGEQGTDKTGGVNANLWAGLAMLVVGVGFAVWAKVRPVVVPQDFESSGADGSPHSR